MCLAKLEVPYRDIVVENMACLGLTRFGRDEKDKARAKYMTGLHLKCIGVVYDDMT